MKEYCFEVNGLLVKAKYEQEDIDSIFKPLLKRWKELYEQKQERIFIYMAAPAGSGKTTLSLFLQYLSKEEGFEEIQSIGMDGFHYTNAYLNTHYDENHTVLKLKKGHETTFDVESLEEKIIEAKYKDNTWPLYSREIHDPIEDKIHLNKNIILLEGNYLLLNKERWKKLLPYAQDTLFLICEDDLRKRLINRKIKGGLKREEAESFYERSDKINVEMVLNESIEANVLLKVKNHRYTCIYKK